MQTTCQCEICANAEGNQIVTVREMMFGFRDEFTYFKCSSCGCLQIVAPPKDLSKYYPNDKYYSFHLNESGSKKGKIKNLLKCSLWHVWWHFNLPMQSLPYVRGFTWFSLLRKKITKTTAIADIGCGNGFLLQQLSMLGFQNLTGIDPFIENDISYSSGIKIWKTDIYNYPTQHAENNIIKNRFDLIMLHHSFEHMDTPRKVLNRLYELLSPSGKLLIRIPVSDSFAWRKYGVNWYQLDAPRHFFLHTTKSMVLLAKDCGFTIKRVFYDSTASQFIYSEKYDRDISLFETMKVSRAYKKSCRKHAKWLNTMMDGDQACFVLEKIRPT
jgi:2-polyprenyl-3-methyl-5-hydroxy-6-metoxy-1,4-benzoquinol methylase